MRSGAMTGFTSHLLPLASRLLPFVLLLCAAPASAQSTCRPARADTGHVALTGLVLWDGTGAAPVQGMTLLLRGERIVEVFPDRSRPLPPGTSTRSMAGLFAMPGLVDAHVHIATDPSGEDARGRTDRRLCRALQGGVTAVRDMAGDVRSLGALARDARVGDIAAPDIFYSALWAGPAFFADPRTAAASAGGIPGSFPWMRAVDSATDLHQAVAEARDTGATAIKLYADLSPRLVASITTEAHRQGLPVWAHAAIGATTPLEVTQAGVDVVSHATLLLRQLGREGYASLQQSPSGEAARVIGQPVFDSLFGEMRLRGTLYEPTLFIYQTDERRRMFSLAAAITRRAHEAGVLIVAGTDSLGSGDAGAWAAPNIHAELAELVAAGGLTPGEALAAATVNAARALRQEQEFGTIQPGRLANIVILGRDPTAAIGNTRSVRWVVKRGALYRGGGR